VARKGNPMTENRNLKRRVRERSARTGESYTAARRHLVPDRPARRIVIATAQVELRPDPRSAEQLRAGGSDVRTMMRAAREAGAQLVHFPEGALTSPGKRVMSSTGPDTIGESDWGRVDRAVLRAELEGVVRLAGELGLWTVVGSIHFAGDGRPTNCAYVVSASGRPVARYDERMLSRTKSRFMYAGGSRPVLFEAHGVRFGLTHGMETQYPELFAEYERADADCVLFSTHGNVDLPELFAVEAAGHAGANSLWVSYADGLGDGHAPSGVVAPNGRWESRLPSSAAPGFAVCPVDTGRGRLARAWRRQARTAQAARDR
jgi:predicted amidohydrolase